MVQTSRRNIANALDGNICCATKPFSVYQSIVMWKLLKITSRGGRAPPRWHNVEISIDQVEDRFCSIDHLPSKGCLCQPLSWTFGSLRASGYPQYMAKGAPTIQLIILIALFVSETFCRL